MNAPNRFELHVLGEGEQKLSVEEDTKIPNAATITVNKEDHTLAGMLRSQLLLLPHVLFCGYKVPHPLEPNFIIKVQTTAESTPIQAVQEACRGLVFTLSRMRDLFQKECTTAGVVGTAGTGLDGMNGQNGGLGGQGGFAGDGLGGEGLGMGAGATGRQNYGGMEGAGFSEFIE